jgi:hypothetical protein
VATGLKCRKIEPFCSVPLPLCLLQVLLDFMSLFFMLVLKFSLDFKCPRTFLSNCGQLLVIEPSCIKTSCNSAESKDVVLHNPFFMSLEMTKPLSYSNFKSFQFHCGCFKFLFEKYSIAVV